MVTYNISLNKELATLVEKKIKQDKYANRSEFFRQLLRGYLLPSDDGWGNSGELLKRVDKLNKGQEKLTTLEDFDKEFNL